jgi:DNA recombination protein RmuC
MGNHIEKIRLLVEDQLHNNLEKKLNASFSNVADRLAKVHESLGEVNNLSRNMQDMHKLFSNVKTRGIFGEVQLENLLSQMLAPNQYQKNFKPAPYGSEIVEFAVRLPGQHSEVWLPVDAKFPNESMLRIQDSSERGNTDDLLAAQKMLEQQIKTFARDIAKKYINPPRTTDFAIMFLASESLFAETLRLPGLMEKIQMEYRITIAGPTTFCALLCSLQMGFRSLQIQERTADVWKILQEVRLEFNKFASTVEAVQKKLAQAHDQMDDVGRRSRVLEKRLTILEELEEQQ